MTDERLEQKSPEQAGPRTSPAFTASSAEAGFPVTPGSFDTTFNGFVNTFVAKVSASGRRLAYAGYIGGSGVDPGTGLTIDEAGNAYVNGFAGSDESTFPDGD